MNREQLLTRLREIAELSQEHAYTVDHAALHEEADDILLTLLDLHGEEQAVQVFRSIVKGYHE